MPVLSDLGWQVVGVDVSLGQSELARRGGVAALVADVGRLPLATQRGRPSVGTDAGPARFGARELVLQPDFVMFEPASPVVAGAGAGLVLTAAGRPGQSELQGAGGRGGQMCQETAGLRECEADQASCAFGACAAVTAR
ncbi:hypothetical protein SAMN05421505_1633 [Sinosporangium album]|uniref:Uncharacterized protein n=1 Tax=Sinosporangium album TaxID=504805 RepID=A0A1G8LAB8_9ACTN|nr:hypothetical protein SAMN05421505_1633 [Sinosporangium album]